MTTLETLLTIAGIAHFGILIAALLVPRILDWSSQLQQLSQLSRQIIWIHGLYIFLTVASFAVLSVAFPGLLIDGSPLSRLVSGFIAAFWAIRLVIQMTYFDAQDHLKNWFLKLGYHSMTVTFVYFTVVYSAACFGWLA